jgi:hypothetical protein
MTTVSDSPLDPRKFLRCWKMKIISPAILLLQTIAKDFLGMLEPDAVPGDSLPFLEKLHQLKDPRR